MFCNIYFGNIEKYLVGDVFDKSSQLIRGSSISTDCDILFVQSKSDLHLLLRIVDDFLLISTSKEASIRFLKKLYKGIPRLGVMINSDKSRVNYPISLENRSSGKLEKVASIGNNYFPWCGLLIDTRTCEICLDYERFGGALATDTVIIHRGQNEGLNLKKKMKDFVRPRCNQKLFFSSRINGLDMIRLNFYQTFVLCAIKLVHYLKGSDSRICALESRQRQQFIYSSACDTIHFAYLLIASKIKHGDIENKATASSRKHDIVFELTWKDALWLGRHAFYSIFQRSRQHYVELGKLFSESIRVSNQKDLLTVARKAIKMWKL